MPDRTAPEPPAAPRPAPQYGSQLEPGQDMPAWDPTLTERYAPLPRPTQQEDRGRGTVMALGAVPVGVVLWMVMWSFGWMGSLAAFAAAALAAMLYVRGAGRISATGAGIVTGITVVTVLLAFVGGIWIDAVKFLGGTPLSMIVDPEPWTLIGDNLTNPDFISGYGTDFIWAVIFGLLGCFFTLRRLFQAARR